MQLTESQRMQNKWHTITNRGPAVANEMLGKNLHPRPPWIEHPEVPPKALLSVVGHDGEKRLQHQILMDVSTSCSHRVMLERCTVWIHLCLLINNVCICVWCGPQCISVYAQNSWPSGQNGTFKKKKKQLWRIEIKVKWILIIKTNRLIHFSNQCSFSCVSGLWPLSLHHSFSAWTCCVKCKVWGKFLH